MNLDDNDINSIRGTKSFNILLRGNKNTPLTAVNIHTAPVHNKTFRVSSFVKAPPQPRTLHGARLSVIPMTSEDVVEALSKKTFNLAMTDPSQGFPRLNKDGEIETIIDPKTKKPVMKVYLLGEVFRNAALSKQAIIQTTAKYNAEHDPSAKASLKIELSMFLLNAIDELAAALSPVDLNEQFKVIVSVPVLNSTHFDRFDTIDLWSAITNGYAISGDTHLFKEQIREDPFFIRNILKLFDDQYKPFQEWLKTVWYWPMTKAIPIGQLTEDIYRRWQEGGFRDSGILPIRDRPANYVDGDYDANIGDFDDEKEEDMADLDPDVEMGDSWQGRPFRKRKKKDLSPHRLNIEWTPLQSDIEQKMSMSPRPQDYEEPPREYEEPQEDEDVELHTPKVLPQSFDDEDEDMDDFHPGFRPEHTEPHYIPFPAPTRPYAQPGAPVSAMDALNKRVGAIDIGSLASPIQMSRSGSSVIDASAPLPHYSSQKPQIQSQLVEGSFQNIVSSRLSGTQPDLRAHQQIEEEKVEFMLPKLDRFKNMGSHKVDEFLDDRNNWEPWMISDEQWLLSVQWPDKQVKDFWETVWTEYIDKWTSADPDNWIVSNPGGHVWNSFRFKLMGDERDEAYGQYLKYVVAFNIEPQNAKIKDLAVLSNI